jgi:hypothetical protein
MGSIFQWQTADERGVLNMKKRKEEAMTHTVSCYDCRNAYLMQDGNKYNPDVCGCKITHDRIVAGFRDRPRLRECRNYVHNPNPPTFHDMIKA